MTTIRRAAPHILVALSLAIGAAGWMTARMLRQGELELRTAQALAATGELEQATIHARKAASYFVPNAPHVPAAYAQLISIAQLAEGRGDTQTALFAWNAVRTAAYSSRWISVPHQQEVAIADASIARLTSRQPVPYGANQDPDARQKKMLDLLSRKNYPRMPWVFALLGGFVAVSVGLLHIGWHGLNHPKANTLPRLRVGIALTAFGLVAWALALWNA